MPSQFQNLGKICVGCFLKKNDVLVFNIDGHLVSVSSLLFGT